MSEPIPPSGVVTYLFTDVVRSTEAWERDETLMAAALEQHDRIVRRAVDDAGGYVFATAGDGFGVAFADAAGAVATAQQIQAELGQAIDLFTVRMGLHRGQAQPRDGDYFGVVVNRTARIMGAAHGAQILASDAVLSTLADPAPSVDLGLHRLRDLLEPVRLMQIGAGTHPPPNSLERAHHNLPFEHTASFGLDEQVVAVIGQLEQRGLVTLTGVGGVGKTRLALAVAAVMADRVDRTWFVDLTTVGPGADVNRAVAATVGAAEADTDAIATRLRGSPALLVFDNCEHVIDATAGVVSGVRARTESVLLLVTSRESLGVIGEQVYPVAVLDRQSGVRLFVDRALLAGATVDSQQSAAVIESICRQLDGIPLAIELAAARAAHLSLTEIDRHLDERFQLLGSRGRSGSDGRHETLEAAMDWSYHLLGDDDAHGLRVASVFAGGFDAEAFADVSGSTHLEGVDVLGSLIDKSLLVTSTDGPGNTRYRALETVRLYAWTKLVDAGAAPAVRDRHAALYAGRVADVVEAEVDPSTWFPWPPVPLVDRENHLAALAWWSECEDHEQLVRHCSAIGPELQGSGWVDDHRRFFGRPELVTGTTAPMAAARYLAVSAQFANELGRWDEQFSLAEAGRATEASARLRAGLAISSANAASILAPERVDEIVDEALAIAPANAPALRANLEARRADPVLLWNDLDEGAAMLDRLLDEGVAEHEQFLAAEAALVHLTRGDDDRVRALLPELDPDARGVTLRSHLCRSVLAAHAGAADQARSELLAMIEELQRRPYRLVDAEALVAVAEVERSLGDPERACRLVAAVDQVAVRSPGAFRWYHAVRERVRADLDHDTVDRLRREAAPSVAVALADEENRLRSIV